MATFITSSTTSPAIGGVLAAAPFFSACFGFAAMNGIGVRFR